LKNKKFIVKEGSGSGSKTSNKVSILKSYEEIIECLGKIKLNDSIIQEFIQTKSKVPSTFRVFVSKEKVKVFNLSSKNISQKLMNKLTSNIISSAELNNIDKDEFSTIQNCLKDVSKCREKSMEGLEQIGKDTFYFLNKHFFLNCKKSLKSLCLDFVQGIDS